jgi:RNA polymerase sigma-70 factor (ECF subfamily)
LFDAQAGELWRALLVVAGGRGDLAEEATAEAFTRLLTARRPVREPRAWLYRTGFRIVVDELRREQRHGLAPADHPAVPHQEWLSSELLEALRALTPAQRLTVFLVHYSDLPLAEVARRTGSSVPAVKVRLHRARKALRIALEEAARV